MISSIYSGVDSRGSHNSPGSCTGNPAICIHSTTRCPSPLHWTGVPTPARWCSWTWPSHKTFLSRNGVFRRSVPSSLMKFVCISVFGCIRGTARAIYCFAFGYVQGRSRRGSHLTEAGEPIIAVLRTPSLKIKKLIQDCFNRHGLVSHRNGYHTVTIADLEFTVPRSPTHVNHYKTQSSMISASWRGANPGVCSQQNGRPDFPRSHQKATINPHYYTLEFTDTSCRAKTMKNFHRDQAGLEGISNVMHLKHTWRIAASNLYLAVATILCCCRNTRGLHIYPHAWIDRFGFGFATGSTPIYLRTQYLCRGLIQVSFSSPVRRIFFHLKIFISFQPILHFHVAFPASFSMGFHLLHDELTVPVGHRVNRHSGTTRLTGLAWFRSQRTYHLSTNHLC